MKRPGTRRGKPAAARPSKAASRTRRVAPKAKPARALSAAGLQDPRAEPAYADRDPWRVATADPT